MTIRTEKDALDAIDKLHSEYGVPVVIISSSDLGDDKVLIGCGSCMRGTFERCWLRFMRMGTLSAVLCGILRYDINY